MTENKNLEEKDFIPKGKNEYKIFKTPGNKKMHVKVFFFCLKRCNFNQKSNHYRFVIVFYFRNFYTEYILFFNLFIFILFLRKKWSIVTPLAPPHQLSALDLFS